MLPALNLMAKLKDNPVLSGDFGGALKVFVVLPLTTSVRDSNPL